MIQDYQTALKIGMSPIRILTQRTHSADCNMHTNLSTKTMKKQEKNTHDSLTKSLKQDSLKWVMKF